MKYLVTVVDNRSITVEVEADSDDEAHEIGWEKAFDAMAHEWEDDGCWASIYEVPNQVIG